MITTEPKAKTELELVDAARTGDHEAFGQLMKTYQDRLFTSILQIIRVRADAEDVVQDAFVQAYVNLPAFRGKSSFYTWLYRIAMNMAFSHGRKLRNELSIERTRDVMGDEPTDPSGTPSMRLEREEQAAELQQALASLSEEHRTVLILRGVEGFDYETIAEVLNLNPGTVRSRIHRARSTLRERLSTETHCGV